MAEEKRTGFCTVCNKQVMVFRRGTNHILHLLLTLVTFGVWIIVWIGSAVKSAAGAVRNAVRRKSAT
jgi:hypothetical protein